MKKQYIWIVLERWNLDLMDTDASVFSTEELAKAYADYQASYMKSMVTDGTIKHNQNDCYVYVDDDEGKSDEWWEARIVKRGINYEERKK